MILDWLDSVTIASSILSDIWSSLELSFKIGFLEPLILYYLYFLPNPNKLNMTDYTTHKLKSSIWTWEKIKTYIDMPFEAPDSGIQSTLKVSEMIYFRIPDRNIILTSQIPHNSIFWQLQRNLLSFY